MALKLTFLCNACVFVCTAAGQPGCSTPPCKDDDSVSELSLLQTQMQVQETQEHKYIEASKQLGVDQQGYIKRGPRVDPDRRGPEEDGPDTKPTMDVDTACSTIADPLIFESHAWGTKLPAIGDEGFCKHCVEDGHIYVAVGELPLKECGVLRSLVITDSNLKLSPQQEDKILTFDEFHLGPGLPPFRWATSTCHRHWSNMCIRDDTVEQRRTQPIWWQGDQPAGFWSRKFVQRWAKWIEPGSNVIDIGANVGDTTIEMALRAKKTVAIEASPDAFGFLQINRGLNPHLDIDLHYLALGDSDGSFVNSWDGINNEIQQRDFSKFLLEVYGEEFIKRISLIKIDTEGNDRFILRGYKPLLEIKQPVFYVEWFDPWWETGEKFGIDPNSADLFKAIREIGYTPVNARTGLVVDSPMNGNGTPNLFLLPPNKMDIVHTPSGRFKG